jgi:glycosyltransferase involved in cell wall biosynthesis
MSAPVWHLLSGELAGGGIGDYTRLLADALADAGREVHVWAPDAGDATLRRAVAHPLPGVGTAALRVMDAALDRYPAPRRLLVQYAPQAWGMRGMNVPFCRWILSRRRAGDDVRVMFHEPFFPFGWQRPRRNLLAAVNRWMARLLLRASAPRAYVSIRAWEDLLRPLAPRGLEFTTLPIPSTIPFMDDPARVAELRRRLSEDGQRPVFVHFGTYGDMIAPMLSAALKALIERRPDARILLLGSGGPAYADGLRAEDARFADAAVAPGRMDAGDVSLHLQASDVALQPYPDGADTRRTSLMACLANGVPTATTRGRFTDAAWGGSPVRTVPADPSAALADAAAKLLQAPDRERIGRETQGFYRARFAMEHTVARLLADEGGG